jgi:hypothetical protein
MVSIEEIADFVTRHAAERYAERILKINIEVDVFTHYPLGRALYEMLNEYHPSHVNYKCGIFVIKEEDIRIIKDDNRIVTVKSFDTALAPEFDGGVLKSKKKNFRIKRREPKEF